MDPNNPKVVFAAKVSLEDYKEKKDLDLHFDRVIKAEKQHVDKGCYYHVNFKTHLDLSLFPTYICDSLIYEDSKNTFYVQKVACKRHVFWS